MSPSPHKIDRRTLLGWGTATATLGAVGAGCGPVTPSSPKADKNTFTIYWNAGHTYKSYEKVIDQFGKDHDLKINWQKFQWPDLTTKLVADFKSGNVPDLVEESNNAVQYGVSGDVMAVDELNARGDKAMKFPEDFIESAVKLRQYDGKTYGVPLHLTANGLLFYNKAMLEKAGFSKPPTTWDEFLEACKATTSGKVKGMALNSQSSYGAAWYFQQDVTYSDAAKGEFMMPESAATKTFEFLQDLIVKYKYSDAPVASTDYSGPQKLFSAKRAAMFVTGPWDLQPVREGSPDIDLGVGPPLTGKVQAAEQSGSGVMIPAKAKNPELSWELITRLTKLNVELETTKEVGMSMPRKSWTTDPQVVNDETLKTIAASLKVVGESDPELSARGKMTQVADLYTKAYQQIIIQGKPVKKTLATFRDQASEALQ